MDYRNRSLHRKIVLLRIALPPKPVAEMSQTQQRLARSSPSAFRKRTACTFHRQEMVASASDNDPAICAKEPHSAPTYRVGRQSENKALSGREPCQTPRI